MIQVKLGGDRVIKKLAVTGYKSQELGIFKHDHYAITYIKKAFQKRLIPLIDEGLEWVIISGQLGTELWIAELVFDLQIEYPDIKLAILTPYLNQEANWNETNKEMYEFILSQADFVDSITKRPYESPGQLKLKNQYLVQKSDALLVFYDEERQGSPTFMVKEARKKSERKKYDVIYISSYDIEEIVSEERFNDPKNWTS
jgi:uncharacterized phage-like protein YoqJ